MIRTRSPIGPELGSRRRPPRRRRSPNECRRHRRGSRHGRRPPTRCPDPRSNRRHVAAASAMSTVIDGARATPARSRRASTVVLSSRATHSGRRWATSGRPTSVGDSVRNVPNTTAVALRVERLDGLDDGRRWVGDPSDRRAQTVPSGRRRRGSRRRRSGHPAADRPRAPSVPTTSTIGGAELAQRADDRRPHRGRPAGEDHPPALGPAPRAGRATSPSRRP